MRTTLRLVAAIAAFWIGAVSCRAEAPKEAFEHAAKTLKFLAAADLLHDRFPDRFNPAEDLAVHNKTVSDLFARNDAAQDLLPLLKHDDPKVRTLAVAALNHLNDPKLLPHLLPLCDDSATTLPHPGLVASLPGMDKDTTPLEPQTVANFPRAIINQYLSAAGYESGIADFDAYWTVRKDRPFCASWFKVQLDRATQGSRSVPAEREPQLRALRDQIAKLPEKDRAWTTLYLSIPDHLLFDEKVCLATAKSLGPDALLTTLQGKCPSEDPDLHPHSPAAADPTDLLNLWTLHHATELLRPKDAETLLHLDRMRTPWYAIAAATLTPGQSKGILADGFTRFPNEGYTDAWARADLAIALWQLQAANASADLIHWFYSETLKNEGVPHSRVKFLQSLDAKDPKTRLLLSGLVNDSQFTALDWSSLKALIAILNQWLATPVVTPDELAALQHPYGEQHAVQRPEQAAKTYPTQTTELNQTLTLWRQKIKQSLPQWSSANN
jgi:hypothetical protein